MRPDRNLLPGESVFPDLVLRQLPNTVRTRSVGYDLQPLDFAVTPFTDAAVFLSQPFHRSVSLRKVGS